MLNLFPCKRKLSKNDKKSMVGVPILLNLIKLEFLSSCLLVNRLVGGYPSNDCKDWWMLGLDFDSNENDAMVTIVTPPFKFNDEKYHKV